MVTIWRTWRRPRSEAIWGLSAFSFFYVFFESLLVRSIDSSSSNFYRASPVIVGFFYVIIGGTLLYRVIGHARVEARPEGLFIANPFRGDQMIAWGDIASMKPDRLLIVTLTSGQRVIAWVIQKNGIDRAKHRRTESDKAIDELGVLAGRALGRDALTFTATA